MTQNTTSRAPSLDQQRARHAWDAVQRAKSKTGENKSQESKKFGGQAKKLPVRIMASGLGQSLAFLRAKNYAPGLLAELDDWIKLRIKPQPGEPSVLLERIVRGDSTFLHRATDEVLGYLQWLTRFAEAEGLTEENES
jgi:CRISPR-associated protein Cmr5